MTQRIRWMLLQLLRCLICVLTGKKRIEKNEESDEKN